MNIAIGTRIRVVDPADKRKRVNGTVTADLTGKGRGYMVLLDDETDAMEISRNEITGKAK